MSQLPLLHMGIHGMGPTMGLLITLSIATTTALMATTLVATTLTLGLGILGIWVDSVLLSKMARLAIVVASSS